MTLRTRARLQREAWSRSNGSDKGATTEYVHPFLARLLPSREVETLGGFGTGSGARGADGRPAGLSSRVKGVACGGGFTLAVTQGGEVREPNAFFSRVLVFLATWSRLRLVRRGGCGGRGAGGGFTSGRSQKTARASELVWL